MSLCVSVCGWGDGGGGGGGVRASTCGVWCVCVCVWCVKHCLIIRTSYILHVKNEMKG